MSILKVRYAPNHGQQFVCGRSSVKENVMSKRIRKRLILVKHRMFADVAEYPNIVIENFVLTLAWGGGGLMHLPRVFPRRTPNR